MKLHDEHVRSYMDDIRDIGLLEFLTWKGNDVSPTWKGAYQPATNSTDAGLVALANFNRDHYLFYRALVERHVEKRGKVLDLGCGTGARTAMLGRYSEKTYGLDSDFLKISAAANLNGDGKITWVGGNFMTTDCTETFDYIFAVEVVEHIEPELQHAFIGRAIGLLESGGSLILTTPKDKEPERKPPHIGLWFPKDAAEMVYQFKGTLEYFNQRQFMSGGENPWSEEATATHYVMTVRK